MFLCCFFFFFKQKTAYEMRISDWSSDVCSSDLRSGIAVQDLHRHLAVRRIRTRLEYQNPVGAARRQSIGENASGRAAADDDEEIGRASCRERVCQYV